MTTSPQSSSPDASPPRMRRQSSSRSLVGVAVLATVLFTLAACGKADSGPTLKLTAALPNKVPSGTELRIGDPQIQALLRVSGLDKQLTDAGVKVQWADLSGGPQTIQAFRGDKLDCGAVADIPSLFAAWTGTPTKIVFQSVTIDPLEHPTYQLGVAPGVKVSSLADLRGKKVAYSAGQAQGALVLRVLHAAGLSQKDVKLVDMTSKGDTYVTALGGKAVDVAPLGIANVKSYKQKYPAGSTVPTGIRDDAETLYCLTKAVQDAGKAAALKVYVGVRTKAVLWGNAHPAELAKTFYEDHEGLSAADARDTVALIGPSGIPANWSSAQTRLQQTADLLAAEQDHKKLDVSTLVDRRFEKIEAAAAGANVVTGAAA